MAKGRELAQRIKNCPSLYRQPAFLVQQMLQLRDLVRVQASVPPLPTVKRLLADPHHPVQLGHRTPTSACCNTATICSTENASSSSAKSSALAGKVLAEDLH